MMALISWFLSVLYYSTFPLGQVAIIGTVHIIILCTTSKRLVVN